MQSKPYKKKLAFRIWGKAADVVDGQLDLDTPQRLALMRNNKLTKKEILGKYLSQGDVSLSSNYINCSRRK